MRPRIRCIKPELWQWEPIGRLTHETRALMVGLVTMADDHGRLRELTPAIAGHVFPYQRISPRRLAALLATLERQGLIHRYDHDRERYLAIVGWNDRDHPLYQHVNRKRGSQLPPPPAMSVSPDQGVFVTAATLQAQGGIGSRIGTEGIGS